jgi:hypothetical protein
MNKKITMAAAISLSLLTSQVVNADARTQAKRIFDRLTGTTPDEITLTQMEDSFASDSTGAAAADIAMLDPAFYNVTLKNFAAPWTNEEQTVFTPLNDYTATVVGMIRDDVDFRQVLYGDIIYTGNNSPAYENFNNAHYEALEALGPVDGNLGDPSILIGTVPQSTVKSIPNGATAGVMTTRAAAKSFFYLGTNRAMFRFTLMNHLCTDLEPIKDNTRPANRVRQDVSRSPGGDSRIFLNSCIGCHAGMDGLAGAFAYYELDFNGDKDTDVDTFENSATMTYATAGTPEERVSGKHLINENNFNPGNITTDDSWINYWRNGQNSLLGWNDYTGVQKDDKGHAIGTGAKSLGMELAHSDAFAQCQVKKVFRTVCLRDADDNATDRAQLDLNTPGTIANDFVTNGYNMKTVFRGAAAYCKGE